MGTKTEHITILASPEFKTFLTREAARERISISELVRRRCERHAPDNEDERVFAELVVQLRESVKVAGKSLDRGIRDAESVLKETRA